MYGTEPIIDIDKDGMGLHRDRCPDASWDELRKANLSLYKYPQLKEIELDEVMRTILLEDLAYAYGTNTKKFNAKLKEFGFIK